MTTSTTTGLFDTTALVNAIQQRDAAAIVATYAPDAVVTILDRDHPPATPWVLAGRDQVEAYYRDICGRNIDHTVPSLVSDQNTLAFEQHCHYPEGNSVVCLAVASLDAGRITRQTIAQVWD